MLFSLPPVKAYDLLNKFMLPEEYHNVVVLHLIKRLPQQVVADELGMTLETCKRRFRDAIDMIDKSMDCIK